jgi:predicted alpha/beta-hydrolase family hydrolase
MSGALFVLAHGAGVGQSSDFMRGWAQALSGLGTVHAFEYDYMERPGRRPPDRLPRLLARHEAELASARANHPDRRVILVGKSMGSRVGCHLSAALPAAAQVSGLVCLGYPLKGARTLRDEVLVALSAPVLFIQGTRDPLCPLDLLAEVRPRMVAPTTLHVVDGGDHSLQLRAKDLAALGVTQDAVDRRALRAVADFVEGL